MLHLFVPELWTALVIVCFSGDCRYKQIQGDSITHCEQLIQEELNKLMWTSMQLGVMPVIAYTDCEKA